MQWEGHHNTGTGYYTRSQGYDNHLIPVEFNQDHIAWVEVQ